MNGRDAFVVEGRVAKRDAARQIAYSIVLEPRGPENPDAQGDWYTAEDIELAAHGFLEATAKGEATADFMHDNGPAVGYPVESYIAPVAFTLGDQLVPAGAWVAAVHYPDPDIWAEIVSGDLAAFSVGGTGRRE